MKLTGASSSSSASVRNEGLAVMSSSRHRKGLFRRALQCLGGARPFLALLTCLAAFPSSGWANIVTYTHTVRQPFNGSQSPDDARMAAIAKAKREVLEKAGTYLDSIKVVKDHQLVQNQIVALSSAVLQAEIISQKNYASGETFGVEIEAKVCVDTATLEERVKAFLQDQSAMAKAEKLEQREKELLARISDLEERNRKAGSAERKSGKKGTHKKKLSREFTEVVRMLSAVEANRKALALWDRVRFIDPEKALAYLNEAIRKDAHFAEAFNNRGIAYADLGRWREAIKDYDRAIQLESTLSDAFNNRGTAHANLGETQQSIEDFERAIQLNPGHVRAHYNRGTAYSGQREFRQAISEFDRAIELDSCDAASYYNRGNAYAGEGAYLKAVQDYDRAIKIDPDKAEFYFNRGVAYANLGQYQPAADDFDKAIRLDPKDISFYCNRGIVLFKLEQYQRAIKDFDQVIYFRAKDVDAYKYRGLCYLMTGEHKRFCSDLETACNLGDCEKLKQLRNDGYCK
jgi:tetratricopeptide (TPR) repeat protein